MNKDEQWYFPPDKNLKVPEKLKKAIIYFEDRQFYYHFGINPVSIFKSFTENIVQRKVVRGGSTITMQVARMSEPKNRNYFNKIKEIFLAIKIELWNSKENILQMYVDNAPYGGNIIGYQAASLRYYQKSPEQLTWGEACTLAVLPNAPGLISPISNKNILINKRNNLLKTLLKENILDQETYKLSILEPIPSKLNKIELIAPHLSQELKDKVSKDYSII
ncbi:MAG: transglycosylase domain-containing protein, partial [Candidatus Sericytochromatia bacterium]|nr:transglycosylase domain-containing protein [Candidatus Sericytochromatia bacterium]